MTARTITVEVFPSTTTIEVSVSTGPLGPQGPPGNSGVMLWEIDSELFDGERKTFANVFASTPSTVMAFQTGIGKLWSVATDPGVGEFAREGKAITLGTAPERGDRVDGFFVPTA